MTLRFLHGADFHLDSPFSALPPRQAAERRRELRQLPQRLAEWTESHPVDLVLLSGDLLDSASVYRDTAEALRDALGRMDAPVFIAPGNHDWYGPGSPYAAMPWPENVHIFSRPEPEAAELPEGNTVVYGAAFTGPERGGSPLADFRVPEDGRRHLMVLHGELDGTQPRYAPIASADAAGSGLHYLALGHIHSRGARQLGRTLCAWPGCPEGRGFDETGDKGFYYGEMDDGGGTRLEFVPFALRRYETVTADVTGKPPLAAVEAALPSDTARDLYRITLTGETEQAVDLQALQRALEGRFCALTLTDDTRTAENVWARAEEDSLRGLFLRELRRRLAEASTEEERRTIEQAARYGLAALDRRDLG
ncbi:metallophosphoesterase family protein [Dysosmobacter sp.]|uniref:metallophosphoesterase family protein n=1 Tax=Dysosmobacter sp. TaxID=2591382 RepID=UPI002A8EC346|nr:DNA repair exonuclease [Dysosmobacter sp.]MDY3281028.1 DNA repair exonuclease [Dysosmobacter sp.]